MCSFSVLKIRFEVPRCWTSQLSTHLSGYMDVVVEKDICCVQGDKERALGMSISPLMDRNQRGGITRSQVSLCDMYMVQAKS